jgi:hypothetical protein
MPFLYIHKFNVMEDMKGGGKIEIHLLVPPALTYEPYV